VSNYTFDEVREIVLDVIEENINRAGYDRHSIPNETDLMASGILDSFGFLESLASIEDSTGLDVDYSQLDSESFTTLQGLVKAILR